MTARKGMLSLNLDSSAVIAGSIAMIHAAETEWEKTTHPELSQHLQMADWEFDRRLVVPF